MADIARAARRVVAGYPDLAGQAALRLSHRGARQLWICTVQREPAGSSRWRLRRPRRLVDATGLGVPERPGRPTAAARGRSRPVAGCPRNRDSSPPKGVHDESSVRSLPLSGPSASTPLAVMAGAQDQRPRTPRATRSPRPATFAGECRHRREVLGFDLGDRDSQSRNPTPTSRRSTRQASDVSTATLATSHQGRALRYALVGTANRSRRRSRQPRRSATPAPARRSPRRRREGRFRPAILWVAGNVHGGEESGTDAVVAGAVRARDRTDCAAATIQDNAVVAILPSRTPTAGRLTPAAMPTASI